MKARIAGIATITAVALTAIVMAPAFSQTGSNKVVVAQGTDSLIFMPAYVAKAKGYFAEEGLDGEIKIFRGGVQALAGVMAGDAQVYIGPPSTAMKAIEKGQDITVYAANMTQIPTNIVIQGDVAKSRNITASSTIEDRLKALRGLTMGVNAAGSAPDQVLRFAARSVGIDPDKDMRVSPVGAGAALIGSFEQKRIDGFAFSSPASDIAVDRFGGLMVVNFAKGEYEPLRGFLYLSLISRTDWLKQDPQRAAKTVRAFWKAQKLINEKPEEARAAVRTFFPSMDEEAFNGGFAANAITIPATVRIDRKSVVMNKEFSEAVENIKLNVDVDKVFTNEYVDLAEKMGKI